MRELMVEDLGRVQGGVVVIAPVVWKISAWCAGAIFGSGGVLAVYHTVKAEGQLSCSK